jgi:hypothetical protein
MSDEECFGCGSEVKCEEHHFPISKLSGGKATIPLCSNCHDLVSRIPMIKWPDYIYIDALRMLSEMPLGAKLAGLKFIEKGF